jgi:hypothetical protein
LGVPLAVLLLAGALYAGFSARSGVGATYRQVLAVVAHSSIVWVLRLVFVLPANYVREAISGGTTLAVLVPFVDEGTFVARLAGMVDVFAVWWIVLLATGIAVLYRRKTGPIALSFLAVYGLIALGLAALLAARSGS